MSNPTHELPPWEKRRILENLIVPTLSSSEQACINYLIRHQLSLVRDEAPTVTTPIITKQFQEGTNVGQYVFDLGANITQATAKESLMLLTKKELVQADSYCRHCLLIQKHQDRCERCNKKTESAYSLPGFTKEKVKDYLNDHYEGKHAWNYDETSGNFYVIPPLNEAKTTLETPPNYESLRAQLRNKLWFPLMVDKAVEMASSSLKGGQVGDTRVINGFYKPILEMQEEFQPEVLKRALQQTLRKRVPAQKNSHRWWRYTRAVATNQAEETRKTVAAISAEDVKRILGDIRNYNIANEKAKAFERLHFLLQNVEHIRQHFAPVATVEATRNHVLQAFKRGLTDYRAVQRYSSPYDFLPNWEWGSKFNEKDKKMVK